MCANRPDKLFKKFSPFCHCSHTLSRTFYYVFVTFWDELQKYRDYTTVAGDSNLALHLGKRKGRKATVEFTHFAGNGATAQCWNTFAPTWKYVSSSGIDSFALWHIASCTLKGCLFFALKLTRWHRTCTEISHILNKDARFLFACQQNKHLPLLWEASVTASHPPFSRPPFKHRLPRCAQPSLLSCSFPVSCMQRSCLRF